MAKKSLSGKKVIKGLLFGSLVGGATALLFAPRSGKETKELITKEVDDTIKLVTDVKNSAQDVQTNIANLEDVTNELLPEFIEGTQKSLERFEFRSKYRINDIKNQIEKINTEMENLANELNE